MREYVLTYFHNDPIGVCIKWFPHAFLTSCYLTRDRLLHIACAMQISLPYPLNTTPSRFIHVACPMAHLSCQDRPFDGRLAVSRRGEIGPC